MRLRAMSAKDDVSGSEEVVPTRKSRGGILPWRYVLCFLVFLSLLLVYAMRINLSVSIIAMTYPTATKPDSNLTLETCRSAESPYHNKRNSSGLHLDDNNNANAAPRYDWDEDQQSTIMYSFFVGYLLTQIAGGYLSEQGSVKWVLGAGVGLTSLLTCLTSWAASYDFYALVAVRILEGITEGVAFPAAFAFAARWFPVDEQTLLVSIVGSGSMIGTIVTLPVSAMLCNSPLGWPASFYIFGGIGLVWTAIWLVVAADCPEKHPWISGDELAYIVESRPAKCPDKRPPTPWKRILLSPAVICLSILKLASTFNYYMMLTELPNYLDSMFGIDITNNGLINSGMNLGLFTSFIGTAYIADKMLKRAPSKRTLIRKIFVFCGTIIPSSCMFLLPFVGCNYELILGSLLANSLFLGFSGGGDSTIILDLSPQFAGTVAGIVNMASNVAGPAAPKLVGILTKGNNSLGQWNRVFIFTGIFTAVGSLIFLACGTAEQQSWDIVETDGAGGDIAESDQGYRRFSKGSVDVQEIKYPLDQCTRT